MKKLLLSLLLIMSTIAFCQVTTSVTYTVNSASTVYSTLTGVSLVDSGTIVIIDTTGGETYDSLFVYSIDISLSTRNINNNSGQGILYIIANTDTLAVCMIASDYWNNTYRNDAENIIVNFAYPYSFELSTLKYKLVRSYGYNTTQNSVLKYYYPLISYAIIVQGKRTIL